MTGRAPAGAPDGPIAGVVLAAGLGSRFGGAKLRAMLHGRPIIEHVLDTIEAAQRAGYLGPVVVVHGAGPGAGADAATVRDAANGHDVPRVENDDPGAGLSRSLRLALAWLEPTAAPAALILLADQPRTSVEVIGTLVARWRSRPVPILVPRYERGGPGNPVLLAREVWTRAAHLRGDRGMSTIIEERADLVDYLDVAGANPDVDTPAQLDALAALADIAANDSERSRARD